MVEAGGSAIAQDEATSVVWGMPGAVAQAGLCHAVLPLPRIAPKLLELLRGARRMSADTILRLPRASSAEEPLRPRDRPGQALSAGDAGSRRSCSASSCAISMALAERLRAPATRR